MKVGGREQQRVGEGGREGCDDAMQAESVSGGREGWGR